MYIYLWFYPNLWRLSPWLCHAMAIPAIPAAIPHKSHPNRTPLERVDEDDKPPDASEQPD